MACGVVVVVVVVMEGVVGGTRTYPIALHHPLTFLMFVEAVFEVELTPRRTRHMCRVCAYMIAGVVGQHLKRAVVASAVRLSCDSWRCLGYCT